MDTVYMLFVVLPVSVLCIIIAVCRKDFSSITSGSKEKSVSPPNVPIDATVIEKRNSEK